MPSRKDIVEVAGITRRTFVSGSIAIGGLAFTVGAKAPAHAPGRRVDPKEWSRARHGYFGVAAGVVAPGMLVPGGAGSNQTFHWWTNVLLPESGLPQYAHMQGYPLDGIGGLAGTDQLEIGEPVVPPVYLDEQPLHVPEGAPVPRIGYADVGLGYFFPWRWIQVTPQHLKPGIRKMLNPLDKAMIERRGHPEQPRLLEIWTPPHEVPFVKQLFAQMWEHRDVDAAAAEEEDLDKGVGPPVSVGMSLDFDNEGL